MRSVHSTCLREKKNKPHKHFDKLFIGKINEFMLFHIRCKRDSFNCIESNEMENWNSQTKIFQWFNTKRWQLMHILTNFFSSSSFYLRLKKKQKQGNSRISNKISKAAEYKIWIVINILLLFIHVIAMCRWIMVFNWIEFEILKGKKKLYEPEMEKKKAAWSLVL